MRAWLVGLLLCVGMPAHASPPDADTAFWRWFAANAARVAKLRSADEKVAGALADALHRVDPGLTFELGITTKPRELILSADGVRKLFPTVKRLVAAAPSIPGWKVIAFRPRKDITTIQLGRDRALQMSDLRFRLLRAPGATLDVAIYAKPPVDRPTSSAVYLLLDALLGEYDVETRLGEIQILDITTAPTDARPFQELAPLVDRAKR